ncbi:MULTISPECIES: type II toxin-antitoxin system RelE/ParE family toxin [Gordonibacter]|uniref:type II toxin-antitoxin system RelE/ParE family toxin n=1 Tax=Gordonibacter TaxID=644652 RepID=UPI00242CD087|nr:MULTISPECIES: type II toxin-antitoxin system RelE/ParE family toxin [Gordonibacter]
MQYEGAPSRIAREIEVRILFAFDPKRHAIMLFAGDKSSGGRSREKWNGWYRSAIPLAEKRYREHLGRLE